MLKHLSIFHTLHRHELHIYNNTILFRNDGSEAQFSEAPEYDEAGELIPPKQDEGPWNKISAAAQEPAPKPEERKPGLS